MRSMKIAFLFCLSPFFVFAEDTVKPERVRTIDVTLRIDYQIYSAKKSPKPDPVLNRANLIAVKQFILQQGKTQTYCNMYNDNPAYSVDKYHFYLNPDTGQQNINCDPKLSDFQTLIIRNMDWGRDQYRDIEFKEKHWLYIKASWPHDELSVGRIRDKAEEALKVILEEMKRIE